MTHEKWRTTTDADMDEFNGWLRASNQVRQTRVVVGLVGQEFNHFVSRDLLHGGLEILARHFRNGVEEERRWPAGVLAYSRVNCTDYLDCRTDKAA